MDASARSGAAAAGISVKGARAMQVEFLRTGRVGADLYEGLIGVSEDFAATLNGIKCYVPARSMLCFLIVLHGRLHAV